MSNLVEANTSGGQSEREQQMLDVLAKWDGTPWAAWRSAGGAVAARGGGANMRRAAPARCLHAAAIAPSLCLTSQAFDPTRAHPLLADAFFNQDAQALKALLADDVVQHAGARPYCRAGVCCTPPTPAAA
jgi:hypothetical protein